MKNPAWNTETIREIIRLGRLPFLGAGFILYATGAVLAAIETGHISAEQFIAGYLIVMPAHLSVSYSNDYYDFDLDRPDSSTKYSGGSGVLQRHPELRSFAWRFAVFLIAASITLSIIYTITFRNPSVLLLTVSGSLLGWFYSAPPLRLSYRGLGEPATAITGFIFPAMGYSVMAGGPDIRILLFSVPIMLLQLVFIINVEIPDLREDLLGGKMTLPVHLGVRDSRRIMILASATATVMLALLSLSESFSPGINFLVIAALSLTVTIPCIHSLYGSGDREDVASKSELVMNSLIVFGMLDLIYLTTVLVTP